MIIRNSIICITICLSLSARRIRVNMNGRWHWAVKTSVATATCMRRLCHSCSVPYIILVSYSTHAVRRRTKRLSRLYLYLLSSVVLQRQLVIISHSHEPSSIGLSRGEWMIQKEIRYDLCLSANGNLAHQLSFLLPLFSQLGWKCTEFRRAGLCIVNPPNSACCFF